MRSVILVVTTAFIISVPLAATVRAEDTTVIKKDQPDDSTTVIKKRDDVNMFPIPHPEEHETVIKKEHHDYDFDR